MSSFSKNQIKENPKYLKCLGKIGNFLNKNSIFVFNLFTLFYQDDV
jgi:hypothetical protein